MDAATQAWVDQHDAHIAAVIRRHGWYIAYIGGGSCSRPGCDGGDSDEPAFAYTVGLFGLAHQELLIFGVEPDTAAGVLNTLGSGVRGGEPLLPGQLLTFDEWPHRIVPEPVPNPSEIVFEANRFYQRPTSSPSRFSNSATTTPRADSPGKTGLPPRRRNRGQGPSRPEGPRWLARGSTSCPTGGNRARGPARKGRRLRTCSPPLRTYRYRPIGGRSVASRQMSVSTDSVILVK